MIPPPIALGLTLCDQVIIEEGTRKVSLIGAFSRLNAPAFPFVPPRFCVFATLTGGQGQADVTLAVTDLETDEEIASVTHRIVFPDRFAELRVLFRLADCTFPAVGTYLFTLLVDDDWVAHRRLQVRSRETNS